MIKNKFSFILFSLFLFFFSCKTTQIEQSNLNENYSVINSSRNNFKIYFPQFYDDNDNAILGDGILIIFPNHQTMVIDGFKPIASDQYINFLKNHGVTKIDYLVATHYHSDHIGTFVDLLSSFDVGTLLINGAPTQNYYALLLEDFLSENPVKTEILKEGDSFSIADIKLDVLWPTLSENDIYNIRNNPGRTEKLINLSSLVFKLTYKDFSILFTGDIYQEGDKKLVKKYGTSLKSTILKVPHHGEWYTANSPKFAKTVNADYGVIQDNRYITSVIKNRYKKAGTKLLYRLQPGYIFIETDGIGYDIHSYDGYQ